MNAVQISASGSFTTDAVDMRPYKQGYRGVCSVSVVITGSGTGKIEYLVPTTQTDNSDLGGLGGYVEPTGATDVGSGATVGSYALSFTPIPCDAFKLKVTETGGVNSITVTLYVSMA